MATAAKAGKVERVVRTVMATAAKVVMVERVVRTVMATAAKVVMVEKVNMVERVVRIVMGTAVKAVVMDRILNPRQLQSIRKLQPLYLPSDLLLPWNHTCHLHRP